MKSLILCFILAGAFAYGDEITDQFPKHPTKFVGSMTPGPATNHGIKQIGISFTGCFGTCPSYMLIVNSDGTFHYSGGNYAKRGGDWHGTVDPGQLNTILNYIAAMNYFALKDEYSIPVSDGPGVYTMVATAKRKKTVYDYMGTGPSKLAALEQLINGLMQDATWKRH